MDMDFSLLKKTALLFIVIAGMIGVSVLFYLADQDIFWGLLWFIFTASFLNEQARRLGEKRRKTALYSAAVALGIGWMLINGPLLHLLVAHLNANPYGEYFIAQFRFRLLLSVFILDVISRAWLTDARVLIVFLLFAANAVTFPAAFKYASHKMPQSWFEFILHTSKEIIAELRSFLGKSFVLFVVNTSLWFLAAFFLRFDNFIILTAIMALCTLTPSLGLFIGAAISIVFVESGLFMLQIGGIFIATASIWFVDFTIFKERDTVISSLQIAAMVIALPLGYVLFSFAGLFAAAPLTFVFSIIASRIFKNFSLIHTPNSLLS